MAAGILERERGETIRLAVADPSIFRQDGGPSIGERMRRARVGFRPADNTRVGKAGALSGWDQLRARIVGVGRRADALCVRHLPRLHPHGAGPCSTTRMRAEDLDTGAEDHIADEARYACLSRPLTARHASRPAANPPDRWEQEWGRGTSWKTMPSWKVL